MELAASEPPGKVLDHGPSCLVQESLNKFVYHVLHQPGLDFLRAALTPDILSGQPSFLFSLYRYQTSIAGGRV